MKSKYFGAISLLVATLVACGGGGGGGGTTGITVNGKVLRFDGTPAQGVVVQIGDATADNRVQVNSDSNGDFTANSVTSPDRKSVV